MSFREELPANCPPPDAGEISAPLVVFRAVRSLPPTEADFDSLRKNNPKGPIPAGITECQMRGLSVFTRKKDCEARVLKLPRYKNHSLCRVQLGQGAGKIQQTFAPSHHTWWPFASFNILAHCVEESP